MSFDKSGTEIKTQIEHKGKIYNFTYHDGVPTVETDPSILLGGVHSFCFYNDKLVIVRNRDSEWTPPGGSLEKDETYEEASIREVKEESNMKVIHQECIGYQDIETPCENKILRQFRMFCIVEPYGDFESDPDGDILEIKAIDPRDYKEYIKWGEIGDRLVQRALEMKEKFKS